MTDPTQKTIELRGGPLHGKRITINSAHTQTTQPVNSADKFSAWVIYRPTQEQCADGTEVWVEYLESHWGDTGLTDL